MNMFLQSFFRSPIPRPIESERYVELQKRMKISEKASPITSPRIVAFVNRPFTQYRTRIPTVPSGLATLIVGPGPRPSLQSTAGTRLLVSHRSQYSPYAEDSQYRPPPQFSHDL